MKKTVLLSVGLSLAAVCAFGEVAGYARQFTLTVSGEVADGALSDFPLLVRLSEGVPGFKYADSLSEGRDIRFTLEDGTELAYERDTWNPEGESVFWVKVPSLEKGLKIKLHYGKADDAGPTPEASSVWSAYTGVWHVNETADGATAIADSSANGLSGTGGGKSLANADGYFGGARGLRVTKYNGAAFYVPQSATLDGDAKAYSFSCWVRAAGIVDWSYVVARKSCDAGAGWGFQFRAENTYAYPTPNYYYNGNKVGGSGTLFTTNEWVKLDVSATANQAILYLNGQEVQVYKHASTAFELKDGGLGVGGLNSTAGYGSFCGDVDEFRYSTGTRSAEWIKTSYENERRDSSLVDIVCDTPRADDYSAYAHSVVYSVSGYTGLSVLTNFPLLVKVSPKWISGFSYRDVKPDGSDIIFSLSDGTALAHDLDTWNPDGLSSFWVQIPRLTNGVSFVLHYGGPASFRMPAKVWREYAGVWHMNETAGAAATVRDATENGLTGTGGQKSLPCAEGVVGGARGTRVNGTNGAVFTVPCSDSLDLGDTFTVSGWIRPVGLVSWAYIASRKTTDGTAAWGIQFRGGDSSYRYGLPTTYTNGNSGDGGWNDDSKSYFETNVWSKVDVQYIGKRVRFYINGELAYERGETKAAAIQGTVGLSVGGLFTNGHGTFNGDIDEFRYSSAIRSGDWVKTEYLAASANESLLTWGEVDSGLDRSVVPPRTFEWYVPFAVSGYEGTLTLANFPVLVKVSEGSPRGFSYGNVAGLDDIRFVDGDGRLMAFECEAWNVAGESRFWVTLPTLAGTDTAFRMYYGKRKDVAMPGGATAGGWRKAGYAAVWHMDVSSDYKTTDSLGGIGGSVTWGATSSMIGAEGLVGGAYVNSGWGTHRGMSVPANAYAPVREALVTSGDISISAWVRNDGGTGNDTSGNYGVILNHFYGSGANLWEIGVEGNTQKFTVTDSKWRTAGKSCIDLSDDWHLVTVRYEGNQRKLFFDGVANDSFTVSDTFYDPRPEDPLRIGTRGGQPECSWIGGIDEVRFRTAATSEDWMKAEVGNLKNPAFLTVGNVSSTKVGCCLLLW